VHEADTEIFFRYRGKYIWGLLRDSGGECILWYYPKVDDVESLLGIEGDEWNGITMVVYRSSDIGTREARASFNELYNVVKERAYGMDDVLDDIISDADLF
jgi:hypothetical protein